MLANNGRPQAIQTRKPTRSISKDGFETPLLRITDFQGLRAVHHAGIRSDCIVTKGQDTKTTWLLGQRRQDLKRWDFVRRQDSRLGPLPCSVSLS